MVAVHQNIFYVYSAGVVLLLISTYFCHPEFYVSLRYHAEAFHLNATNLRSGKESRTKSILLWNGYDRIEMKIFLQIPLSYSCLFNNCQATSLRQFLPSLDQFDAIIFNMAVLHKLKTGKLPPSNQRKPHQRYIFFTQESPVNHVENVDDYVGYFNWTMSYLHDSDIWYPYGRVLESLQQRTDAKYQTGKKNNKTKLLAWFASHCSTQSNREKYVHELQKYIPIDIYGRCGTKKCGWNELEGISRSECYDMLENNYKFYLSFENSLCKNYVTEKFYSILKRFVVPVVMGVADYSVIAPPHSFIDALRYSPKELAALLLKLDANETLYRKYFEWKTNYTIRSGYEDMGSEAFCRLCTRLNQDKQTNQMVSHLSSSWKPTRCLNSRYVKVFHRPS